jgi:peptidoglycan/xylan/chitin deacetylase (PgdA/CDA1 family)
MPNYPNSPNTWLFSLGGHRAFIHAIQDAYRRKFKYWLDPAHIQIVRTDFSDRLSGIVQFQCNTPHGKRDFSADFRCQPDGQLILDSVSRWQPSLSRRDFLKRTILLSSTAAMLPNSRIDHQTTMIPLPPCIMLHSQHGINMGRDGFFPQFLRLAQDQQYTTVTFHSWLCAVLNNTPLPENPLIISMDDMAMDVGNPSFQYFRNMHNQLALQHMVGTFGIVTRPHLRQDDNRWDEVQSWADEGFEMATHTSEHTNFNQADTSARVDLSQEHVDAEIINSAHMIQNRIEQPVNVLITPYGSGFNRHSQEVHPDIVSACQRANIRMVVGITDGRAPTPLVSLQDPRSILYYGRTTPGNDNAYEAIYNVNMWGREGVRSVAEATQ